jgi:hypothetical protein
MTGAIDPAVWCPWGYAIASVDARGAGHSDGKFLALKSNSHRFEADSTDLTIDSQVTSSFLEHRTPKMGTMWSSSLRNFPSVMEM